MRQAQTMIRTIGIVGMAGGFLVISPALRQGALQTGLQIGTYLDSHSPYSYAVVAAAIVGTMVLLARSVGAKR
jgi:hypothetical protein